MNQETKLGLRLRGFAGAHDYLAMADVANAAFAADNVSWICTPESIRRDYEGFPDFDPLDDMVMAELDGQLVGYVRTSHWTDESGCLIQAQVGFVHPAFRRRGIGSKLLHWVETRQRDFARDRGGVSVHHVFVTEGEVGRAAMLSLAGYVPARYFMLMERPTLDDIPDAPLPDGFELRPVATADLRPIFEAHVEALQGQWGVAPPAPGDFHRWTALPTFQPHLWQVAWHIQSGRVAGQVKPFINEEQNMTQNRRRGATEFISVGAPWRRRGLARALIARALRAQRDAGMNESVLGVDADNAHDAPRLYESCGFRVVQRNMVLRKPVDN